MAQAVSTSTLAVPFMPNNRELDEVVHLQREGKSMHRFSLSITLNGCSVCGHLKHHPIHVWS